MARVSTSPQRAQVRDSSPSSVPVAGLVTSHAPQSWPSAGISAPSFAWTRKASFSKGRETFSALPGVVQVGSR